MKWSCHKQLTLWRRSLKRKKKRKWEIEGCCMISNADHFLCFILHSSKTFKTSLLSSMMKRPRKRRKHYSSQVISKMKSIAEAQLTT